MRPKLFTLADPLRCFSLVTDTREQMPYAFTGAVSRALRQGDYTFGCAPDVLAELTAQGLLDGIPLRESEGLYLFDGVVAVERKRNIAEFHACCAGERKRFEAELKRLAVLRFPLVVCEFHYNELKMLDFKGFGKGSANAALNSVLSWIAQFRIPFLFAGNRQMARSATYEYLKRSARNILKIVSDRPTTLENKGVADTTCSP